MNKKIEEIKFKFTYIIILFIISSSNVSGMDPLLSDNGKPIFEIIDRNSGLSNLSVSSIIQDRYGFLWFGTQSGLNYYDGRDIEIYRNDPFQDDGLVHNLIQTMYYDEENHELWIGTYQGISRFDINRKKFKNYMVGKGGLSNPIVIAIIKDKDNIVWAGTMEGLNRIDPNTGDIIHYDIPGNVVRSLHVDSTGNMYIGTHTGLYVYNEYEDSLDKVEVELPSPYVMVINEYEEGILSLGLWDGGLIRLNLQDNKTEHISFEDNRVYTMIRTVDGVEWIGTWGGGLFTIADGISRFSVEENNSLPHPIVYSILQDHTGILWIGTNGGGIAKLNPRKKDYVKLSFDKNNENSLSPGKINSIYRDSRGKLWIAVYNNGLNRYNPETGILEKFIHDPEDESSIISNQVMDIIQVGTNRIYFGTSNGVAYYDYQKDSFFKSNILPSDTLVYAVDRLNDEYWIGTYRKGLYRYNSSTRTLANYNSSNLGAFNLSNNLVYDVLVDSKERIWVGTNNGLNMKKPKETNFTIYNKTGEKDQLASSVIRALFEDSKGRIWIGMNGGGIALYNEDKENFTNILEIDGLASNIVVGILEDIFGRLWVATHNGISIVNPDTEDIYNLTPQDGIGGWEFNTGRFKDKNGNLLFGGVHGITVIPSTFTATDLPAPRLYITRVDINQENLDLEKHFFNDEKLSLSYKENFIGFEFAAIDYDSPDKTTYSFMLEGLDSDYIQGRNRNYVTYSNLRPGKYTFKVKAETARGIQSNTAKMEISIKKPWFRSSLAYFLYLVIFIFVINILIKLREGQILKNKNCQLSDLNEKLEIANKELEEISIKDPLTKVYNRRYFEVKFKELIHLARRGKIEISLMILDLDGFKPINDNYGHLVGDRYLQDLAQTLNRKLYRATDFVARYGGDEFVIALFDTDKYGASVIAEKLRLSVSDIRLQGGEIKEDKKLGTTASIGIASFIPGKDTKIEDYLDLADEALYESKKNGKNRITVNNKKSLVFE